MKNFLLLPFILFSFFASGQDFIYNYEYTVGANHIVIRDVIKTSDANLMVAFDLEGTTPLGTGRPMAGIMKLNASGFVIWSKLLNIPGTFANCSYEVKESASGNFYLWGLNKTSVSGGTKEATLCEISANGEILWFKKYDFGDGTGYFGMNRFTVLPSGELEMMISIYENLILMRTTATGEIIWGKSSYIAGPGEGGGKNPGFDFLSFPGDGGICSNKNINDFALIRYAENGDITWTSKYKLGFYNHAKTMIQLPDGDFMVGGYLRGVSEDHGKVMFMKVSNIDGSVMWIKRLEETDLSYSSDLRMAFKEENIIVNFSPGFGTDNYNYYVEIDTDANIINSAKTKLLHDDYNDLEVVNETEIYVYGSSKEPSGPVRGIIQRTDNLFDTDDCNTEDVTFTMTDFTDYEELPSTGASSEFSNMEIVEIGLVSIEVRMRDFCTELYIENNQDDIDEVVIETSSIENESKNEEINVYPNPASSVVNFTVSDELLNASYAIVDLSGKNILTGSITQNQFVLDLPQLRNGQYLLRIESDEHVIVRKVSILQ
ncbi:MAG: T9SS type A sorting domain-containing protein [Crocinitomix sp.]|nr:T9SS type A sorting domain-containing protein [Crocinitomix sp.]